MKALAITATLATVLQAAIATGAFANDTMAVLGAGGLVFTHTDQVTMAREDLFISPERVDVKYTYRNTGDHGREHDRRLFPCPRSVGRSKSWPRCPTSRATTSWVFSSCRTARTIEPNLQQRAVVQGIDFTESSRRRGFRCSSRCRTGPKAVARS